MDLIPEATTERIVWDNIQVKIQFLLVSAKMCFEKLKFYDKWIKC